MDEETKQPVPRNRYARPIAPVADAPPADERGARRALLMAVALYLLFLTPGRRWFRRAVA